MLHSRFVPARHVLYHAYLRAGAASGAAPRRLVWLFDDHQVGAGLLVISAYFACATWASTPRQPLLVGTGLPPAARVPGRGPGRLDGAAARHPRRVGTPPPSENCGSTG
ncbi:hypothetical protein HBB16_21610 [Pseudonocardia sp. MCCB 268]|nr:hypothetical protein [Pseudonocardia cytotoxica]